LSLQIPEDGCDHLLWLFNKTLDEGLRFRRSSLTTDQVNQSCDLSVVKCLCAILESLMNFLYKEESVSSISSLDTRKYTHLFIRLTPHPHASELFTDRLHQVLRLFILPTL
jgi:hypothetical protein